MDSKNLFDKCFTVKYQSEDTESFCVNEKQLAENVYEIEFSEQVDYSKVDYIEYNLHTEQIRFGDEGFYIIPGGGWRCANGDYSLGHFKESADGEVIFWDAHMPVYGISHEKKCCAVIVTGMKYNAGFVVDVSEQTYKFKLRFEVNGEIPYENMKAELHWIEKENATWCDIAREYRSYQLAHGFRSIKERLNPELKYSVESPNVRIRMAWKPVPTQVPEQTIENEPEVHVACTFEDVIRLMESYKKAGIKKAEFCLVGWNIKGHDGRWPQILPVESSIGGEEGLKAVIEKAKELGYAMTCHTNSTDGYTIANNLKEDDIAVKRDGTKNALPNVRWSGGRTYNICPKRGYEIAMETLPEVAALGFRGMHYIDVITCTPAYAHICYHKDHPVNRKEACEYYDRLFLETKKMFGSVGCEGSFDHSLKNCDFALYNSFSNYKNEASLHALADRRIPFWQVVYHGIVASNPYACTVNAIASDDLDDLLKVIEYGGKAQIYYYAQFTTDNSNWIGRGDFHCNTDAEIEESSAMVKETMDIFNELTWLQYEFMEEHREIAPGVFEITYSDGSIIRVDYNKKEYTWSKNGEEEHQRSFRGYSQK